MVDNQPKKQPDPAQKQAIPAEAAQPKKDKPEQAAAPGTGSTAEKKPDATKPTSRMRRVGQFTLISFIVLLVVYAAGALTTGLLYFRPANQALEQTQQELEQANERITALETQADQIKSLEAEKQESADELARAQIHIALLRTLADVNAARIALSAQDTASASLYLTETPARLEQLGESLGVKSQAVIASLQQRLGLVSSEISRDRQAALTDLALIANDLIQIENTLFAGP